jgi:hypothetical protein
MVCGRLVAGAGEESHRQPAAGSGNVMNLKPTSLVRLRRERPGLVLETRASRAAAGSALTSLAGLGTLGP